MENDLDHWRLCDEISVMDAALLISGLDPAKCAVNDTNFDSRNPVYTAARTALINAVRSGRLKATIRHETWLRGYNEETDFGEDLISHHGRQYVFKEEPEWFKTTIMVDALKDWLSGRGFRDGFFFPKTFDDKPNYLSEKHPHYSAKLAAAIEAWLAVNNNQELVRGKSVKQALLVWLRTHAGTYGLTKEDGNPNENGIEEVAKVANWETKGGAPKTP